MYILETTADGYIDEYETYADALEDMLLIMEQDKLNGDLVEYKITEIEKGAQDESICVHERA